MRRWIIGGVLLAMALFVGSRNYIADHGQEYLQEVLDSYNRGQEDLHLELSSYDGGWSGAEARIRVRLGAGTAQIEGVRDPLILKFRVEYGPLVGGWHPGLIRLRSAGSFSRWLEAKSSRSFLELVPKDIRYRYDGWVGWWHTMHERIRLSRIDAYDQESRERLILEPVEIRDDYALSSQRGRAEFVSKAAIFVNGKSAERVEISHPRLNAVVDEFNPKGFYFGSIGFSVREIRMRMTGAHPHTLRFSGAVNAALRHQAPDLATFELKTEGKALNSGTSREWEGLEALQLRLRVESLGIGGIEKLLAMEKERQKIREELARAVGKKDDIAMQKAILALQALDNGWIDAYNALLLPGRTHLVFDETLKGEKRSHLHLELTFTGQKLPDDPFRAMVALTTGMDRLAEGRFDLAVEARLLARMAPQGKIILDSMVQKGLASLKEGVYRFTGELRKGKIIIHGTRYAPQELIMMILM